MYFNSLIKLKAPKLWEESNVQSSSDRWVENNKSFLEKYLAINLFGNQLSNLQVMNERAQKAVARFLNASRLENVLMGFKKNIVQLQACSFLSKVDDKDL